MIYRRQRRRLAVRTTLSVLVLPAVFACASGQPEVSTAFDPWARFPAVREPPRHRAPRH